MDMVNWFKLLKIRKIVLITNVILTICIVRADDILNFQDSNLHYRLVYKSENQQVSLFYKQDDSLDSFKEVGPFNVDSPSSVENALEKIRTFFKDNRFSKESQREIINRVEEFKFISSSECKSLYFSMKDSFVTKNQQDVLDLLSQVEKLKIVKNPGKDAYRSVLIEEFLDLNKEKIQLRMLLDKDGDFLKFSFASKEKNLSQYSWKHEGANIHLNGPDGPDGPVKSSFLSLNYQNFDKEGGTLIVRYPSSISESSGIEETVRSLIKVKRDLSAKEGWTITSLNPENLSKTEHKAGVNLTTKVADHEDIVQVQGTDLAYSRFMPEDIQKQIPLDKLSDEGVSAVEKFYNRCSGELLGDLSGEKGAFDLSDSNQEKICKRYALLNGIGIYLEEKLKLYDSEATGLKSILDSLRVCLVESEVGEIDEGGFVLTYNDLKMMSDQNFDKIASSCTTTSKMKLIKNVAMYEINKVFESKDSHESQQTKNLVANTVLPKLENQCLRHVPSAQLNQCLDYNTLLINEKLVLTKIMDRLVASTKLDKEFINQQKERLFENNKGCRNSIYEKAQTLLKNGELIKEKLSEIQDMDLKCSRSLIKEFSFLNLKDDLVKAIERTGFEFNLDKDSDYYFKNIEQTFNQCLDYELEDEGDLNQLIGSISFFQESCLTRSVTLFAKTKLLERFDRILKDYDFFIEEEERENIRRLVENQLDIELKNWKEIEELTLIYEELLPDFYDSILLQHLKAIDKSIPNKDDDIKQIFNRRAKGLLAIVEDPIKLEKIETLKNMLSNLSQVDKKTESFLDTGLKEVLRELHKMNGQLIILKELKIKSAEELVLSNSVSKRYEECMDGFTPNGHEGFKKRYYRCERKRLTDLSLELARKKLQKKVGLFFPLTSNEANRALSPIHYLKKCFEHSENSSIVNLEVYKKVLDACGKLAEGDISRNLSVAQLLGYKSLLSGGNDGIEALNNCYHNILDSLKVVEDPEQRPLVFEMGGVLSYIISSVENSSDNQEKNNLFEKTLNAIINNNQLDENWWSEQFKTCEDSSNRLISEGMREFTLKNIPFLAKESEKSRNYKVTKDFLDYDILRGIIEFKKSFEKKYDAPLVDIASPLSLERVVHPDMGINSVKNLLEILGDLLDKGFVFDEEQMQTELHVFKSELKSFLKMMNANPQRITIREARKFFQSSLLAEHLSLAIISQKIEQNFNAKFNQLEQEEIESFKKRMGCYKKKCPKNSRRNSNCRRRPCLYGPRIEELKAIELKYEKLRKVTEGLTSFVDLRRVVNSGNNKGRRILSYVKKNYLMPKILGEIPSEQVDDDIVKMVGDAIVEDSTPGGYSDLFVSGIAEFILGQKDKEEWPITKWLFYQSKDFDWSTLKETPSGKKAVEFYAKNLLLPSLLGNSSSLHEKKYLKEFERLLKEAQNENNK